jgi:hypothetical protein
MPSMKARQLRVSMTDAEKRLWSALRLVVYPDINSAANIRLGHTFLISPASSIGSPSRQMVVDTQKATQICGARHGLSARAGAAFDFGTMAF